MDGMIEFDITHKDNEYFSIRVHLESEDPSDLEEEYLKQVIAESGTEFDYRIEFEDDKIKFVDPEGDSHTESVEGLQWGFSYPAPDRVREIPEMVIGACSGLDLGALGEYWEAERKFGPEVVRSFLEDVSDNLVGLSSSIEREFYGTFESREALGRSIYSTEDRDLETSIDFYDYAEKKFPSQIYDLSCGGIVVFTG